MKAARQSPFHAPRGALQVFTAGQLHALWWHLNNGNLGTRYVLGVRARDGSPGYFRQKTLDVKRGITWVLATVQGKKEEGKRVAFVPYSFNERHESVWGAFDFDAHDGNWARARNFAERATELLRRYDFAVITEESGGGFHVWAIACESRPVSEWRPLFEEIAAKIGAGVESGVCELYPVLPKRADGLGKGLRAPGSWHPSRGDFARIVASHCGKLLNFLSGKSLDDSPVTFPKEKQETFSLLHSTGEGNLKNPAWIAKIVADFSIASNGHRHARLEQLTGHFFNQVGRSIGRALAMQQFRRKLIVSRATESEHLAEFESLWCGLNLIWLGELSTVERAALDRLQTENERDALRIFRSFARKASAEGRRDFPIARDNLAERLDITPQGAGLLRMKFCKPEIGLLAKTTPAVANVSCARYVWLPSVADSAGDPF